MHNVHILAALGEEHRDQLLRQAEQHRQLRAARDQPGRMLRRFRLARTPPSSETDSPLTAPTTTTDRQTADNQRQDHNEHETGDSRTRTATTPRPIVEAIEITHPPQNTRPPSHGYPAPRTSDQIRMNLWSMAGVPE